MVFSCIAWLQLGISFLFLCVTGIGAAGFSPCPQHFHNLFAGELFDVSVLDSLWNFSRALAEAPGRCYSFRRPWLMLRLPLSGLFFLLRLLPGYLILGGKKWRIIHCKCPKPSKMGKMDHKVGKRVENNPILTASSNCRKQKIAHFPEEWAYLPTLTPTEETCNGNFCQAIILLLSPSLYSILFPVYDYKRRGRSLFSKLPREEQSSSGLH